MVPLFGTGLAPEPLLRAGVKASGSLGDFTFDLVVPQSEQPHRPERVLLKHGPSSYFTGEPPQRDPQYEIALMWTDCHFGGERPWFRCPNTHCQRRVVHLLLPPGGLYFLCRQCYRLAYGSQAESRDWRR